jgi:hypothetical protein
MSKNPNVMLTLNAAFSTLALAALAGVSSVRVRETADGAIQIRPTDRASDVNLPKGETLRTLGVKSGTSSRRFTAPLNVEPGTVLRAEAGKYGWFTLRPTTEDLAGAAGGRVSAK